MGRWTRWSRAGRVSVLILGACLGAAFGVGLAEADFSQPIRDAALIRAIREGNVEGVREALASGANPNARIDHRFPVMDLAVENNQPEIVSILMEAGVDMTRQSDATGFLHSVRRLSEPKDQKKMYRLLLQGGARLSFLEPDLLLKWVEVGDYELLEVVIDSFRDLWGREQGCPLVLAIRREEPSLLRELLEAGLDANGLCEAETPLLFAVNQKHLPSLLALVDAGADLDQPGARGATALIAAARQRWIEGARLLVQSGADVNQIGGYRPTKERPNPHRSDTPLLTAVTNQDLEMVRVLIEGGADPTLIDPTGRSPIAVALGGVGSHWSGSQELLSSLLEAGGTLADALRAENVGCDLSTIRFLLTKGLNPDQPTDNPALVRFAYCGLKIVEPLLAAGGDVNISTPSGKTPLMVAVAGRRLELTNRLIELGAEVNREDFEGKTALFYASGPRNPQTWPGTVPGILLVKALHAAGADLFHVDHLGRNALTMAAMQDHWHQASFLLRHGVEELRDRKGDTPYELYVKVASPREFTLALPESELEIRVPGRWTFDNRMKEPLLATGRTNQDLDSATFEIRRLGIPQTLEEISPRTLSSLPSLEPLWREVRGHRVPLARAGALEPDEPGDVELTMVVPVPKDALLVRAKGSPALESRMLWTLHMVAASVLPKAPQDAPAEGPWIELTPRRLADLGLGIAMVFVLLVLWWVVRRGPASTRKVTR